MAEVKRAIEIDGKELEMPTPDSFSIAEWKVVYKFAGLSLTDFTPADSTWSESKIRAYEEEFERKLGNPGYIQALVHIAYVRDEPDVDQHDLAQMIEGMNLIRAVGVFGVEDDADPPELTDSPSEPESSSTSSLLSSPAVSLSPSSNGSETLDELPANTGTTRSGTSSPSALSTLER